MTTLIRCDKCGSIRKLKDASNVQIKIISADKEKNINKDLCADCLQKFLKNIDTFFKQ